MDASSGHLVYSPPSPASPSSATTSPSLALPPHPSSLIPHPSNQPVLRVHQLARAGVFSNITFEVRAGEVVGLAGLVGAGRSEVANCIFGVDRPTSGSISIEGVKLRPGSISDAMRRGVALVPEDRQHLGLVLPMPVGTNLTLAVMHSLARGGFRSPAAEAKVAEEMMRELAVRAAGPWIPAETLSGGNQQKLVIGKWLASRPKLLILDEPTRGVDVGAKAEVYRLVRSLAASGMATLLISSDLPEVLALSDRILVMQTGRLAGELSREEATPEKVLSLALPADAPNTSEAIPAEAP